MKPNSRTGNRMHIMRLFTLIELLIVISIIAILMAILLPTLKTVRDKVVTIECLNNIRQIGGNALHQYLLDNNDWFPFGINYSFNPAGEYNWYGLLEEYLYEKSPYTGIAGGDSYKFDQVHLRGGYSGSVTRRKKTSYIHYCPARSNEPKQFADYAYNGNYLVHKSFARKKAGTVQHPTKLACFADGTYASSTLDMLWQTAIGLNRFWHDTESANFTFLDGHAITMKYSKAYVGPFQLGDWISWSKTPPRYLREENY